MLKPARHPKCHAEAVTQADRGLFAKLATQTRSLDMREVLQYELGALPWSLATIHGEMQKTGKSKLLSLLEASTAPGQAPPPQSTIVLDGMAVFQATTPVGHSFEDVAEQLASAVFSSTVATHIDFVVDRYPDMSVKGGERLCRETSTQPCCHQHPAATAEASM